MSQTFYSVSAPAGSGKTYALIGHAIAMAHNNQKLMIAQPSEVLINQTERDIKARDPSAKVTKILWNTVGSNTSVVTRILAHMAANTPGGEILLISQQALGRLPKPYRQFWHLVVDEVPGAFQTHSMNIAKSHGWITQHMALGEPLVGDNFVVEASDVNGLRQLAANQTRDTALALFKLLAEDVLNPDKIVVVNRDAYEKLVAGQGTRTAVDFFSFQKSDYVTDFASTTVMGANFDDTELAKIWEKLDSIEWKPHPVISQNLRYTTHQSGNRLTIKYLIHGNWSQYFGSKRHDNGTVLDRIAEVMAGELGDEFLWQANKKHENLFFDGERLPQMVHGINRRSYQSKHGVALVKAINHSSGPAAFLKDIGFTAEELKVTLQYQNEYQAMMRCSLRDPNAKADVTVCVVSEGSARWLERLFPGSRVEKIASDIPEPNASGQPAPIPKSQAERTWDSRELAKVREAAARGEVYEARPWTPRKSKTRLFKIR